MAFLDKPIREYSLGPTVGNIVGTYGGSYGQGNEFSDAQNLKIDWWRLQNGGASKWENPPPSPDHRRVLGA